MLPIKRTTISYQKLRTPPVPIMLNISIPTQAFTLAPLPVTGVGLARTEFIIARAIQVHPLAALAYKKLDRSLRKKIAQLCAAYQNPQEFFVAVLAQECATIAAAFWPKPVYVRFSDFKTNEYCDLLGGSCFEPQEENPMLGKRGAFRYYTPPYNKAFALECAAIKRARTIKGFTNIHVMVPMIRSAHEAETIHELLKKYGLLDTHPRMNIIAMCEVPACALALDAMCRFVDGFSIGSNDLTQFVLAADRDDPVLAATFNEQNTVVRELMAHAIKRAHACKKPIGICGQGPSDDSQLRTWLIAQHIDYISLNPDAIVTWLIRV
jgi:pyruvate,water dikinase